MVRRYLQASLVLLLLSTLLVPLNTFAKGGRGFSGGGSFSGGSRPGGFSSGRSFSTPRSAPAPSRGTFKPAGGFTTRYDNNAASAQRAQSSKSLYEQANGVFNGGRTTTAQRVGPVNQETIDTRPARQREVFSRYAAQPVTIYHDSFNPFFWMWLMDRSQRDRDLWVYNHRDEMDQERYRDLARKDADLEHRLNELENQGFLGVAIVGSGDRVLVDQSSERLPVCHQRQSGPTPNEAIRCRSKATEAERSAVGKK